MSARPLRRVASIAAMAVALSIGTAAEAADSPPGSNPWTLEWSAPSDCPTKADLDARLAGLLATSHPTQTMAARIDVDKVHGAFRARLRTRLADARGERTLTASTCDLVTSAAALVLALTLDPDLRVSAPEPVPPPPVLPPPSRPTPVEPSADGPPPTPRSSPWFLTVTPRIGVDEGTLPALASGGGLAAGARHGVLSFDGYGEAWLTAHAVSGARAGSGGAFTLVDVGARGCLRTPGELHVGGCVGPEVDRMHGAGFGVTNPGSANRTWISPRVGAEIGWRPIPQLEVPLSADLLAPLARPTFALQNVGTVFVPGAVALRVSIGVTIRFP